MFNFNWRIGIKLLIFLIAMVWVIIWVGFISTLFPSFFAFWGTMEPSLNNIIYGPFFYSIVPLWLYLSAQGFAVFVILKVLKEIREWKGGNKSHEPRS